MSKDILPGTGVPSPPKFRDSVGTRDPYVKVSEVFYLAKKVLLVSCAEDSAGGEEDRVRSRPETQTVFTSLLRLKTSLQK